MRFWFGMSATMVAIFSVGAFLGWWLRGRGIKEEMRSVVDEMMGNDIWPGEGRS